MTHLSSGSGSGGQTPAVVMSRPPVLAVTFVVFASVAAVLVGVPSVIVSVELKAVVAVLVELRSVRALVVTPFVAAVSAAASTPVMPTVVSPVAVGGGEPVVVEAVLQAPS